MKRMIAVRTAYAVGSLLIISMLVFAATRALPGDAAVVRLGKNATPEALKSFRDLFHLDDPISKQYVDWLGDLLHGRLGVSFASGVGVGHIIGHQIVNSLVLLLISAIVGMPLAVALGVFTAVRRDRFADHATSVVMLVISALPEFVLGILLVSLLATNVAHVFPAVSPLDPSKSVFSQLDMLVLPALTLILVVLPYVARTVRVCMIEALDSDYVTWARLKGISERQVIVRHALPNIAGPVFQVIAQSLAYLAGGIVVIETVFQYPGIGEAFISAVQTRDIPVIQAIAMLLAAFYVVVNILADVGTVAMTPTMRKGAR
jgi:peptide/nickel transport system permease protein